MVDLLTFIHPDGLPSISFVVCQTSARTDMIPIPFVLSGEKPNLAKFGHEQSLMRARRLGHRKLRVVHNFIYSSAH